MSSGPLRGIARIERFRRLVGLVRVEHVDEQEDGARLLGQPFLREVEASLLRAGRRGRPERVRTRDRTERLRDVGRVRDEGAGAIARGCAAAPRASERVRVDGRGERAVRKSLGAVERRPTAGQKRCVRRNGPGAGRGQRVVGDRVAGELLELGGGLRSYPWSDMLAATLGVDHDRTTTVRKRLPRCRVVPSTSHVAHCSTDPRRSHSTVIPSTTAQSPRPKWSGTAVARSGRSPPVWKTRGAVTHGLEIDPRAEALSVRAPTGQRDRCEVTPWRLVRGAGGRGRGRTAGRRRRRAREIGVDRPGRDRKEWAAAPRARRRAVKLLRRRPGRPEPAGEIR